MGRFPLDGQAGKNHDMARGPVTGGEVVIYEQRGRRVRLEVRLEGETVWLSLNQMADLFERDPSVIGKHLRSVYASGELERGATAAKSAAVRLEGDREVTRQVEYFNLDAILSVGYRVNSKRGTQFRIWATRTLRDHLLRGYTLNERRLREKGLGEMEEAVALLARTLTKHELVTEEGRAVLDVIHRYTRAWRLLVEYDERRLSEAPARPRRPTRPLPLDDARGAIASLRAALAMSGVNTSLFGQERETQLEAILGNVEQTFGGKPLYPSVQARAAHLLYFLVKDHPFLDGNKRIGTLLFLEYLRRNGMLVREDGSLRLADNAMVALALLVAESEARHKDLMIRLTLSLLEDVAP
jgi:prophage maintenance system killer protein